MLDKGPHAKGIGPGDGMHCDEIPHTGALTTGGLGPQSSAIAGGLNSLIFLKVLFKCILQTL